VRLETAAESGNAKGVGLGLALANRIVEAHGGQVQIDDSPLGGCKIRTTWPK
jgi:two-component system osmolarity sensor histidine kinase EnvZ